MGLSPQFLCAVFFLVQAVLRALVPYVFESTVEAPRLPMCDEFRLDDEWTNEREQNVTRHWCPLSRNHGRFERQIV